MLIILTHGDAGANDLNIEPLDDVVLYKDQKAPFDGVLVPEINYRQFGQDILELEILKKNKAELSELHIDNSTQTFIFGLGLGLALSPVVVFALSH